jgi:hypothetical protein
LAKTLVFRYGLACCLLLPRQAAHAALIVCSGGVRGFSVGFNAAWSAGRSSRLQGGGLRGLRCPAKQHLASAHLTTRSSGPPESFRICSGRGRRPLSSGVRWAWEAGSGWQRLPACGTVLAGCLLLSRQAAHAALIVCSGGVRGFGVGFNAAWSAGRSSRLQGGGFHGVGVRPNKVWQTPT